MKKWSEFLVKKRVDENIFELDDSISTADRKRIEDMQFCCEGVFTDKERVKKTRDKIKQLRAEKPRSDDVTEVAGLILEELDCIKADLKFAKSRRGKFILFVNDWTQELYETLRKDSRFNDIMVGTHAEHDRIVVAGQISDPQVLADAVQLIAKHDPGAQLEYRVLIEPPTDDQA